MNKQEREICKFEMDFKKSLLLVQGCQLPTSSSIENSIDRERIIDDVIIHKIHVWCLLGEKTYKKDVVGIVTFVPDWYYLIYITMAYQGFWGNVRC